MLDLDTKLTINKAFIESPNLCDRFTKEDLSRIGQHVYQGYERDRASRSAWERRMQVALDLAMQVMQPKNFPWPGCSNVIFPLITIAALQFSSRAYSSIIQGTDVVRYRVIGDDPRGELAARADRIGRHMSWQVLEQDAAWEEQHDRLLINLAIIGANFVKTYRNSSLGYNVSELVPAQDFVIDYWARSVESAMRKTHEFGLHRNEIYERIEQGIFADTRDESWFNAAPQVEVSTARISEDRRSGTMPPPSDDEDNPYRMLEQHRYLDLDKDGYAEPYIVTIEKGSRQVCRIVARFENEAAVERNSAGRIKYIRPTEYFTKYSFIPSPDGGIYDLGFGIFLGPLNEAVNSGINQLLDSGTMQNSIGGFLGRGAKIRGGVYTMAPWEWKRVDSTGDDLRKNLVPYPDREPSDATFRLLGLLIEYANRIAGTTDEQVGKNVGQNTPASTFAGMQEQGMQVYGTIYKRVWRSMKEEFRKLYLLNGLYTGVSERFGEHNEQIRREDYRGNPDQIAPVADPRVTSAVMRIQQAVAVKESAMHTPGYDVPEAERRYLRALGAEDIARLYPGPDKVPPLPNPKMAVEQGKLSVKSMDIQWQKQKFVLGLMDQRQMNAAKIENLKAQTVKLMKEAGVVGKAEEIKAVELALDTLKAHGEMINQQIEALTHETPGNAAAGEGGLPGLEGPPGDAGGDAGLAARSNGAAGSMEPPQLSQ